MPGLKDVCRNVRSENTGPFRVTVDLFFDRADNYAQYHADRHLRCRRSRSERFEVKSLNMIKISYPRTTLLGGVVERDRTCHRRPSAAKAALPLHRHDD